MTSRYLPCMLAWICWLWFPSSSRAGEAYYTGFETFDVGENTIAGTDGWTGSYTTSRLHGVMSEAQHGVIGLGNAAFIGGFAGSFAKSTSGSSVYLRRPVNLDPLSLGQEIATFRVSIGIKDSTSTKRDNFEVLIYNQSNTLLGGLQFDNTTLDSSGNPRRLIYRLYYDTALGSFRYTLTPLTFLPDTMERLECRINFRTNRWTASLSAVPVFEDTAFYNGPASLTLGSVMLRMAVTSSTTTAILPGDNYVLFDDYSIRTDPLDPLLSTISFSTGMPKVSWNEEAGYAYQLEYSDDLASWLTSLPDTSWSASSSADRSYNDPTTPLPPHRFYRVKRSFP